MKKGWRCGRQAIGRWTDVAMVVRRLCGAAHAVLPAAVHRRRRLPLPAAHHCCFGAHGSLTGSSQRRLVFIVAATKLLLLLACCCCRYCSCCFYTLANKVAIVAEFPIVSFDVANDLVPINLSLQSEFILLNLVRQISHTTYTIRNKS